MNRQQTIKPMFNNPFHNKSDEFVYQEGKRIAKLYGVAVDKETAKYAIILLNEIRKRKIKFKDIWSILLVR